MPVKTCSACNETKSWDDFYLHNGRPNGAYCKVCHRAKVNASYSPEKNRMWKKRRLERDPRVRVREVLKGLYGITLEEYEAMEAAQGGRCLICGDKPKGRRTRLDVDHCHETGRVRGLLCTRCNLLIGSIDEDVALLQKAIDYLVGAV